MEGGALMTVNLAARARNVVAREVVLRLPEGGCLSFLQTHNRRIDSVRFLESTLLERRNGVAQREASIYAVWMRMLSMHVSVFLALLQTLQCMLEYTPLSATHFVFRFYCRSNHFYRLGALHGELLWLSLGLESVAVIGELGLYASMQLKMWLGGRARPKIVGWLCPNNYSSFLPLVV